MERQTGGHDRESALRVGVNVGTTINRQIVRAARRLRMVAATDTATPMHSTTATIPASSFAS